MSERAAITMSTHLTVASTPEYVGVNWRGSVSTQKGVAEASLMDIPDVGMCWYVNRVLVQPSGARSSGVGSALVARLKEEVAKRGPNCLFVTPGGYGNTFESLRPFYERCGFVVSDPRGAMIARW